MNPLRWAGRPEFFLPALTILGALLLSSRAAPSQAVPPANPEPAVFGRIMRLDPRFDALLGIHARLQRVTGGHAWLEGPVWNSREGYLLYTDIPHNAVFKFAPGHGPKLFLKPSGYSGDRPFAGKEPGANGLTFDAQGRLVLAEHGDRRVTRLEANGSRTVLADRYRGKRLNSPNDVVFKSNGDLYFTDPPFGLPGTFTDPARELDFCGIYRLTRSGELTLLARDIGAPNGIAFSPDERTLYVTDVDPARPAWLAYDVQPDGTIANGRVLRAAGDWMRSRPGGPDGLKTDKAGNIFAAGPGGVYVFAPDGAHLGTIETGVATSNVAWGEDGSVLYITASTAVYRIKLATYGAGFRPTSTRDHFRAPRRIRDGVLPVQAYRGSMVAGHHLPFNLRSNS